MRQLTDDTVLAAGRLTLAAAELEYQLASIDGDPAGVVIVPGEPLRVARKAVTSAPADRRDELIGLVESAGNYLLQSHTAVRALWLDNSRVDAATFDEITGLLLRCRERLRAIPPW
jgi:hypothetical protein